MKKMKMTVSKRTVLMLALIALMIGLVGCSGKVPTDEEYTFENPSIERIQPDEGFKIDGVLDEAVYQNANWLYLNNVAAGNNVNVGVTSQFGEQGLYLVFDVTESVPIYVNPNRSSVLNSGIEFYLAPGGTKNHKQNNFFEIDLLPTGQVKFKKTNGKDGYVDVATTNDLMAYMGATTKGGPVNTEDCYGYTMELFIPWAYMQWLNVDVDQMKDYVCINVAHITSFNYTGTDTKVDRFWYQFIDKVGVGFSDVSRYFKFNGQGAMGTAPITFENGAHYTITGTKAVLPGMSASFTVVPEDGHAVTSLLIDGKEYIDKAVYNSDGTVTIFFEKVEKAMTVSADTVEIAAGNKTLSGQVQVYNLFGGGLEGVTLTCNGTPVAFDANGNFQLKDMAPGYYELAVEKSGFSKLIRGVYLSQDTHVELALKYDLFFYNKEKYKNWILDDQNKGVVYKTNGESHILTKDSYNDFTFETTLRFDTKLLSAGSTDMHLEQRSGMRIVFSNGKNWCLHLLHDKNNPGRYFLQYAAFDDYLFNWSIPHVLTAEEAAKYTSAEGIPLKIARKGRDVAIYLNDKLLRVETLAAEYENLTAQFGLEAWIANETAWSYSFNLSREADFEKPPKAAFNPVSGWDVSSQADGVVRKTGSATDNTWLWSAIKSKDVTTVAKDMSPNTRDYGMCYIFVFSNNQQFRVRLHHTDGDGKYRIQSMSGSTVFDAWKSNYTLTDEQAQKVQNGGISYRVLISGTTAHVYLDGVEVCTYDLSKVVATGEPSGIEKASAQVCLQMFGNPNGPTEIPFKLVELED